MRVLMWDERPRPCQTGRAGLAAELSFLGWRGHHQPSPGAPSSVGIRLVLRLR